MLMCYGMYSDVAYFISIYYYIQICFYSIAKMPCAWYVVYGRLLRVHLIVLDCVGCKLTVLSIGYEAKYKELLQIFLYMVHEGLIWYLFTIVSIIVTNKMQLITISSYKRQIIQI